MKILHEFVAVRCHAAHCSYRNAAIPGKAIGFPSEKAELCYTKSEYPGHYRGYGLRNRRIRNKSNKGNTSMKQHSMKKKLSAMLCMVLIAALALTMTACGGKQDSASSGSISYTVITVDLEGKETTFEITTDKKMVGEELLAQGIIEGEQGEYGLYVKTVNGITLDWDKDGKYWSFYINGEYAMTGVDMTEAEAGATYILKPES